MYIRSRFFAIATVLLCLLLVSCTGLITVPTGSATAAVTAPATASPSPTPADTATASPTTQQTASPTADPTATPDPTATATADPLAGLFTQEGAYVKVPDPDKGPWDYKDTNLNIHIERKKIGGGIYFLADIHTRGPLPTGGFAYDDNSGRKRALPYLIARQNKAVFGITGDYVACSSNTKGVMIRQGKVFYDRKQRPTMAVMPDGDLKIYEPGKITAKELLAQGVQDSFAFGPILVKDGKIHPSVYTNPLRLGNWRAAIGLVEKGHYICIVAINGITLAKLAQLFVDNKCTVAFNMDGGHSTTIVFMGEQLYKQSPGEDNGEQRSLSDLMIIGTNPAVPAPNAPWYCNGMGYNKKNRPAPTDGPLN